MDELDILFEQERIRRRKSYEWLMRDVVLGVHRAGDANDVAGEWNRAKVKEWSRKFKEITDFKA